MRTRWLDSPNRRWRLVGVAVLACLLAAIPAAGALARQDDPTDHPDDTVGKKLTLDTGKAPDGSAYSWFGNKRTFRYESGGERVQLKTRCLGFEFPGRRARGVQLGCSSGSSVTPAGDFGNFGVTHAQAKSEGVAERDIVVTGTTAKRVRRLVVLYTDGAGTQRALDVDFARPPAKRLRRLGIRRGFGLYTAFVRGGQASAESLHGDLSLIASDRGEPLEENDVSRCSDRVLGPAKSGPFELVAYGEDGRELGRARTFVSRQVPDQCLP